MILLLHIVPVLVGVVVLVLLDLIAGDGIDLPRRTPPRSHPVDDFEPHRPA